MNDDERLMTTALAFQARANHNLASAQLREALWAEPTPEEVARVVRHLETPRTIATRSLGRPVRVDVTKRGWRRHPGLLRRRIEEADRAAGLGGDPSEEFIGLGGQKGIDPRQLRRLRVQAREEEVR